MLNDPGMYALPPINLFARSIPRHLLQFDFHSNRQMKEGRQVFQVTPLHLEIVMHYHTRGCDMENLTAPAVRQHLNDLLETGMVEHTLYEPNPGASYRTTERGRVWLEYLLSVPFPTKKWVVEPFDGDSKP